MDNKDSEEGIKELANEYYSKLPYPEKSFYQKVGFIAGYKAALQSAPINEVKEERKTSSAKWDPIKKRIVVDKEQDVKPFDFDKLDADIKRMFPMKQAGRKEFITDDSMEITIFNDSPFDTLEVFSKVAGLINSILPHAQICGGRPVIK